MKVKIDIGQLVLEGMPIGRSDGPRVRAALTAELERLIRAHGVSKALRSGGAVPAVSTGELRLEERSSPRRLGAQIAKSVYGGVIEPR